MKVLLDTNVLISGIFFGGPPRAVLDAWAENRFELLVSPSIFDEYVRTSDRLVPDGTVSGPITADPDDDKFMVCARDYGAIVVSGDKHLLHPSGWEEVRVMRPSNFLTHLNTPTVP